MMYRIVARGLVMARFWSLDRAVDRLYALRREGTTARLDGRYGDRWIAID